MASKPPDGSGNDQLESWKEIAAHFGRDVRTVQRWQRLAIPVRRYAVGNKNSIYASRRELDVWFEKMRLSEAQLSSDLPPPGEQLLVPI